MGTWGKVGQPWTTLIVYEHVDDQVSSIDFVFSPERDKQNAENNVARESG